MRRWFTVAAGLVVVATGCWGSAFAQGKPGCDDKGRVMTPQKVEGVVVYIDASKNLISVREADGKVHDFQASKETVEDMKVGDRIEANLREAPKCP